MFARQFFKHLNNLAVEYVAIDAYIAEACYSNPHVEVMQVYVIPGYACRRQNLKT